MTFDYGDILQAIQNKYRYDLSQWPQVSQLTQRVAQQIRLKEPTDHWGYFPHPEGREDVVGVEIGGRKYGWDIVVGAGAAGAWLNLNPETIDLDGHEFKTLAAHNWLDEAPPEQKPPPSEPPPLPPTTWPEDLVMALAQVQLKLSIVSSQIQDMDATLNRVAKHFKE